MTRRQAAEAARERGRGCIAFYADTTGEHGSSDPHPTRRARVTTGGRDANTRKQHECDAENETSAPGPGALIGLGWVWVLG